MLLIALSTHSTLTQAQSFLQSLDSSVDTPFSPTFDRNILFYQQLVPYSTRRIQFTATLESATAAATVRMIGRWPQKNQVDLTSGVPSTTFELGETYLDHKGGELTQQKIVSVAL